MAALLGSGTALATDGDGPIVSEFGTGLTADVGLWGIANGPDGNRAGCRGNTQTGRFGGGLFTLRQPRAACGRVDVYLRGGRFSSCPRVGARRRCAAPAG